jgi:phage head maturation protease
MFHSCEFEFKKPPLLKKGAGAKNTYSAVASTAALDRHKEVLVPKGVITEAFMKNPIMLNIHNHREAGVGKVVDIKVSEESVTFDFQFADTDEGNKLEKLYIEGVMNAFSVGFIPKNYIDLWDLAHSQDAKLTEIEVPLPDGTLTTIDLTKYAEIPYGIISKWELLEISPVSVPANPEALMLRAKDEIVRKYLDSGHSKAAVGLLERQLSEKVSEIQQELDDLLKKATDAPTELTNVLPYKAVEPSSEEWVAEDAFSALALWAATDKVHAGEAEHTDWSKFAEGFAWVDVQKADQFGSYKYLHHSTSNNELVVVWHGLTNAMADLLGDVEYLTNHSAEAASVYGHLAAHYESFDQDSPEFSTNYTEEQIERIRSGLSPVVEAKAQVDGEPEGVVPSTDNADSAELAKALETGFGEVNQKVADLEVLIRLRMNILARMFDELRKDLLAVKQQPEPEVVTETDEAKLLSEELTSLASVFKQIQF